MCIRKPSGGFPASRPFPLNPFSPPQWESGCISSLPSCLQGELECLTLCSPTLPCPSSPDHRALSSVAQSSRVRPPSCFVVPLPRPGVMTRACIPQRLRGGSGRIKSSRGSWLRSKLKTSLGYVTSSKNKQGVCVCGGVCFPSLYLTRSDSAITTSCSSVVMLWPSAVLIACSGGVFALVCLPWQAGSPGSSDIPSSGSGGGW